MTSEAVRLARSKTPVVDGEAFEFVPHNCFACGTLNEHGLGLQIHVEPGRSWTELELEPRFEGWEGIAHGGILWTILDEVMAWALVAEDNWGVTARMTVDFKKPASVGTRIRADGWVTRSRRRLVDTAARIVDTESGTELATATGVYVAADDARKRELQRRYGFRRLACQSQRGSALIATAPASAATARAVAFVGERRAPAEALGLALSEWTNDPDAFAARLRGGLASLADPEYLDGQRRIAPGIGALFGVRWPLLAAVQRGFRQARGASGRRRCCSSPIASSASRSSRSAGSPSASWAERWMPRPNARGSSCAAPPARLETGSRSTPWPIRTAPASLGSRTAGPSSSSSSTARRAGSVASSGRRSRP